ncbi:IS30 family transposase [Dietzia maris]|uniref:IS30 family transposase n=1 Tax=Dietzia maris TaxID=37915 RepID=UPI0036F33A90
MLTHADHQPRHHLDHGGDYRSTDATTRLTSSEGSKNQLHHYLGLDRPSQIARRLRRDHPGDPMMWVCAETVYQAVYQPGSSLGQPHTLLPSLDKGALRTGRPGRRAQRRDRQRRSRFEQPMLTIHDRPFAPENRTLWGHWEGDLIVGTQGRDAIATLVERRSRMARLVHLPATDSTAVTQAITTALAALPPVLVGSLTCDQGTEVARHLSVTAALGTPVYFCDPHAPWQRGTNENTNGLLRQHFPKGSNLSVHDANYLADVADELNHRPRVVLDDRSPLEFITHELGSEVSKRCVVG